MKIKLIRTRGAGLALLVTLATVPLTACFDNEDEVSTSPDVLDTVPASATTSSRAYTAFAATLPASDSATPLRLGDYTAPTSETETPDSLN
jgi:hypothetical protein